MTATWPPALPQIPDRNGFERRPKSAVITFGAEVGRGKRRRRSTQRMTPISAVFTIDVGQIPVFETWFRTSVADGVLPWTWTDPVIGDVAMWQFDDTDPYRLAPRGGRLWTLTIRAERLP